MTLVWDELLAGVYLRRRQTHLAHVRVDTAFTRGWIKRAAGESLCGKASPESFAHSGVGKNTQQCPRCLALLTNNGLTATETRQ